MPFLGSQPAETALTTGNLGDDIVTEAKINLISTSSVPSVEAKGDGSSDGYIQLNCGQNSHGIKLKSPPHSAAQSYTLTYPSSVVDGGFMKTDSSGNLSFATPSSGPTIGTEIATTSGTSKTFSGIAAGTTRIQLAFEKVGFAGTEVMLIQIGDSGGIETSGYEGGGTKVLGSASLETNALTTCFPIRRSTTADDINGIMTLLHIGNNTWISSHACGGGTGGQNDGYHGGGNKTLSGELTQIQVSGGTFDLGTLNIFTE